MDTYRAQNNGQNNGRDDGDHGNGFSPKKEPLESTTAGMVNAPTENVVSNNIPDEPESSRILQNAEWDNLAGRLGPNPRSERRSGRERKAPDRFTHGRDHIKN